MALRFEDLEPSYANAGDAPLHQVQFIDDQTGALVDPDSVDKLEVFDDSKTLLRSYAAPDVVSSGVGKYQVQDEVIEDAQVVFLRWYFTEAGQQRQVETAFEVVQDPEGLAETRIKDHVLQLLGQGRVRVDLPSGTLATCLFQAKQWYAMHIGENKEVEIPAQSDTHEYDVAPDCNYVINVAFPSGGSRVSDAMGAFGIYGFGMLGMNSVPVEDIFSKAGSDGFFSTIVQAHQYSEMGSRILGATNTWEWLPSTQKLRIYNNAAGAGSHFVVTYVSTNPRLEGLPPKQYMFIERYTRAMAKEALGRIRGKYQSLPGVEGQITMDGDVLLSESRDEKQVLNDEIRRWAPPAFLITG